VGVRIIKELNVLQAFQKKMWGVKNIRTRLDDLEPSWLDQVQTKVDLSVNSMVVIHQEKVNAERVPKD
jgi:hypothetical protein